MALRGAAASLAEDILEPELEIVDPHHHLWERGDQHYLLHDLAADVNTGHRIVSSVYIQCHSMYRAEGPRDMRVVGEIEFVNGVAAMSASGLYGPARLCQGIVGHLDFTIGERRVQEILEAQIAAGNGRFRGIRQGVAWDASAAIHPPSTLPPPGLLLDDAFRAGIARLAPLDLSFDIWLNHPQLPEVSDLARAFPQTTFIVNHIGGLLGEGPYARKRDEVFAIWRALIKDVASCPNVFMKIGGLGMPTRGFSYPATDQPPNSQEIAAVWRPYVEACIEAFGPRRCMFESNFPVDNVCCTYPVLWNVFKRLGAAFSADEKVALFSGTAKRAYRLG